MPNPARPPPVPNLFPTLDAVGRSLLTAGGHHVPQHVSAALMGLLGGEDDGHGHNVAFLTATLTREMSDCHSIGHQAIVTTEGRGTPRRDAGSTGFAPLAVARLAVGEATDAEAPR